MPTMSEYVQRLTNEMTSKQVSDLFGAACNDPLITQGQRAALRDIIMPFFNRANEREMYESREERLMRAYRYDNYDYDHTTDLDRWQLPDNSVKMIEKMSIKALKEASKQLEEGWQCYGQRHKSVTINRVLKEKTHAR